MKNLFSKDNKMSGKPMQLNILCFGYCSGYCEGYCKGYCKTYCNGTCNTYLNG